MVKRKFVLTPIVGFDVTCSVTRASQTDAHRIRSDNLSIKSRHLRSDLLKIMIMVFVGFGSVFLKNRRVTNVLVLTHNPSERMEGTN